MTVIDFVEEQAGEGNALLAVHHELLATLNGSYARASALLTLLRACPSDQALTAGQMAALLAPIEDELDQAVGMAALLARERRDT